LRSEKLNSFYDLFPPDNLTKKHIKRKKNVTEKIQEEITSNIEGFNNYFTAPNIRNKVKHPIFLASKFHSNIKLLFNQDKFPDGDNNLPKFVEKITKKLFDFARRSNL
jgi:hypothetical protein